MRQHGSITVLVLTTVGVALWGVGIFLWIRTGLLVFNLKLQSWPWGSLFALFSLVGLHLLSLLTPIRPPTFPVLPIPPHACPISSGRMAIIGALTELIAERSGLALIVGAYTGLAIALSARLGAYIAVNVEVTWAAVQRRYPNPWLMTSLGMAFAVSLCSLVAYLVALHPNLMSGRIKVTGIATFVVLAVIIATLYKNVRHLDKMLPKPSQK